MWPCRILLLLSILVCGCQRRDDGALHVAAAASLTDALQEVAAAYEAAGHGDVVLEFAGSQTIVTRAIAGAQPSLFILADEVQVERLSKAQLLAEHFTAFSSPLVLIVPRESYAVTSLDDLARPGVRVVLGAEEVPLGRYAREVLRRAGLLEAAQGNLISEEIDALGVLGKVISGQADGGIVYEVNAAGADHRVRTIPIPDAFDVAPQYYIAIPRSGPCLEEGRAFHTFLESEAGRSVMERHQFRFE